MNTTDPTTYPIAASDIKVADSDAPFQKGQQNEENRRHYTYSARTQDALDAVLGSPLAHPLMQLWENLDFLVQTGQLQSVELELEHLDVPCFLLRIDPKLPLFYVELFLDKDALEVPLGEEPSNDDRSGTPVCVLMNWLGSDMEPVYWETGLYEADLGRTRMASLKPDFGELLSQILAMMETKLSPPVVQ